LVAGGVCALSLEATSGALAIAAAIVFVNWRRDVRA
jgi:hypothetical protein